MINQIESLIEDENFKENLIQIFGRILINFRPLRGWQNGNRKYNSRMNICKEN